MFASLPRSSASICGCETPSLSRERLYGGLLEIATDVAGVAVREIRALHHQDISDAFRGIDPGLCAPRAAVAVAAGRQHRGHAVVRRAQDARANSPPVVRASVAVCGVLEKTRRQAAGLRCGEEFHHRGAQIAAAFECAPVEEHLAEARVIGRGRVESAVALRRAVARTELGPRRDWFEQTGLFIFRIG